MRARAPSASVSVPYAYAPASSVSRCHSVVRLSFTTAGMPTSVTRPRGFTTARLCWIEASEPTQSSTPSAPPVSCVP